MTDDHAQQAISCYDQRYIQTPNLDRMAAQGMRFENSFVANSISGPSRACMLTGKHSHANGMIDNSTVFDGSQQTMPKILQKAGYQTAMIGKWHLGGTPTGFDFWEILPNQGSYYNPDFITAKGKTVYQGYVTDIITDMGVDWIKNRDKEKPFCMFLHHKAVHRIWMSDTVNINEFEDVEFPLPVNFWDTYEGRPAAKAQKQSIDKDMDLVYDLKMLDDEIDSRLKNSYGEIRRMTPAQLKAWNKVYLPLTAKFKDAKLSGRELAEWKYQRYMRDYLKCVRSLDQNIGRLLEYLKKEGLLENTLIIYTSDQGFYLGEHGWFDKRFMYEESLRTPLIVRYPDSWNKVKRGAVAKQMVQNIDYAPTILDVAGLDAPGDMHGMSFAGIMQGQKPQNWRDGIYYHYYEFPDEHNVHRHYGVRTERYKLMKFYDGVDSWELYDLKKDPNELANIYGKKGYEKIQKQLHEQLEVLRKQYGMSDALTTELSNRAGTGH